jgi:hypothetical protein
VLTNNKKNHRHGRKKPITRKLGLSLRIGPYSPFYKYITTGWLGTPQTPGNQQLAYRNGEGNAMHGHYIKLNRYLRHWLNIIQQNESVQQKTFSYTPKNMLNSKLKPLHQTSHQKIHFKYSEAHQKKKGKHDTQTTTSTSGVSSVRKGKTKFPPSSYHFKNKLPQCL